MARSQSLSLQQAAPKFRWYAGTFGSISIALIVNFTFSSKSPSFPTAFPLRFKKSLESFSSDRSSPLSQASESSFQRLRWRNAFDWMRYFSLVLGIAFASSSISLYCFLDLRTFIFCAVSEEVFKTIGLPSVKVSSSTSMRELCQYEIYTTTQQENGINWSLAFISIIYRLRLSLSKSHASSQASAAEKVVRCLPLQSDILLEKAKGKVSVGKGSFYNVPEQSWMMSQGREWLWLFVSH